MGSFNDRSNLAIEECVARTPAEGKRVARVERRRSERSLLERTEHTQTTIVTVLAYYFDEHPDYYMEYMHMCMYCTAQHIYPEHLHEGKEGAVWNCEPHFL